MHILMFEDLSVHFIKNGKHIWSLEQSISQVKKVEVYEGSQAAKQSANDDTDESSMTYRLQYLKNMSDKQSIAEIPVRIISRYIQNFN